MASAREDAASAFRLFSLDHPHLARTLRAKLHKRQGEFAAQLAGGLADDWPDYKHRSGVIQGLQEAIEMCEQEEKELRD
jgi:hypothetical protein